MSASPLRGRPLARHPAWSKTCGKHKHVTLGTIRLGRKGKAFRVCGVCVMLARLTVHAIIRPRGRPETSHG